MEQNKPSEHTNDAVPYVTFTHTPGPLNVEFGSGSMPYIIVTPAKVWIGATKYIGDAKLFARAPELLEQLKQLKEENELKAEYYEKKIASMQRSIDSAYELEKSFTEQVESLKEKVLTLDKVLKENHDQAQQQWEQDQAELFRLREERKNQADKYNDLRNLIQRFHQTLIARNYNNIGKWHNERQEYNYELISEVEAILTSKS